MNGSFAANDRYFFFDFARGFNGLSGPLRSIVIVLCVKEEAGRPFLTRLLKMLCMCVPLPRTLLLDGPMSSVLQHLQILDSCAPKRLCIWHACITISILAVAAC